MKTSSKSTKFTMELYLSASMTVRLITFNSKPEKQKQKNFRCCTCLRNVKIALNGSSGKGTAKLADLSSITGTLDGLGRERTYQLLSDLLTTCVP